MEKEQFAAVETEPWWLLERDVDYRIEDLRRKLGAAFEWTDPTWYLQREKLEEVYDFILTQPREVRDELDLATDEERRQRWLDSVIELKTPPSAVPAASTPPSPVAGTPANGAAPFRTSTPTASGSAANAGGGAQIGSSSAAPPRKSAFGSRAQAAAGTAANTASGTQTAPPTSSPPPRPSPFASRGQAGWEAATNPASGSQTAPPTSGPPPRPSPFGSRARAAAGGAADAGPGGAAAENTKTAAEQIQKVLSAPDELSAMARELGLSQQEVEAMMQEPDFASLVAEEQSHLEQAGA